MAPALKSHCKNDHEMTEDNIYRYTRRTGKRAGREERACLTCTRAQRQTREGWLKYTYGITQADFDVMHVNQNGLCAVCGQAEPRGLRVDHDHATKKVRGLLCHHCNVALGHFKDDPSLLLAAIKYLRSA